jgi:cytochrome c-type biogenesis protein CcmH
MIRAALIWLMLATPALAVQPDEVLSDPAMEARARAISKTLRCPVCQSENIDDSDAGLARDLRLLVRERLMAGDSDVEVVDYVAARYGDYVLLTPPARGANLLLWAAGPLLLLAGAGIAVATLRRRAVPEAGLTAEEEARVAELMKE